MRNLIVPLIITLSLVICLQASSTETVNISDANLRAKVEAALGKASGTTITVADMARLTDHLNARNAGIRDLTGLEHATNLKRLWLDKNSISNLSPIADLTNLTHLQLSRNSISDISALAGLTNLTRLYLADNSISNVSALEGLTNLTDLFLDGNNISDISALAGLTNLTGPLWLMGNNISDLSPLVSNTGLRTGDTVDVRRNPLSTASINTHTPALQRKGVIVGFDDILPSDDILPEELMLEEPPLEEPMLPEDDIFQSDEILPEDEPTLEEELVPQTVNTSDLWVDPHDVNKSPLSLGERFTLSATVLNNGSGQVARVSLRYYRSTDSTISRSDTLVGIDAGGSLNASGFYTSSITLNAPSAPGTYYYGACVDPVSNEADTTNNCSTAVRVTVSATEQTPRVPTPTPTPPATATTPATASEPNSITISGTSTRSGAVNKKLDTPLSVRVLDTDDEGVADVRVIFRVTAGQGMFSDTGNRRPIAVQTDNRGYAHADFTPTGVGTITVQASSSGLDPVAFTITTGPPPAGLTIVSGDNQAGTPGSALANPLVVEVQDASGNAVQGVTVTFAVTAGGGSLSARTATTNASGRVQIRLTLGHQRGINSVRASVTGVTPVTFNTSIEPKVLIDTANRPPMLWIDGGALYALVDADVQRFAPSVDNALNIAISGDKVYWTEKTGESAGTINKANLDGTGVAELTSILAVPMGIAVDAAAGKLYWTNSRGRIQSANLDGTGIQNVMQNLPSPIDIALSDGNAYWTQGNGSVRFVNLTGTKNVRNISTGTDIPGSLTIGGEKVYWTEMTGESGGTINSANLNGTGATELALILTAPIGIAIDTARSKLYWTNARGRIQSANLDGSAIKNVVTDLISPSKLAIGGANTTQATPTITINSTPKGTSPGVSVDMSVDVLIYTGDVSWIEPHEATVEAETTKRLLQSAGIQAEITQNENAVKQWMLQTTSDGSVDVLITYGILPTTIYPPENVMPEGSVAEKWIETPDGNTILNHADYLGFQSTIWLNNPQGPGIAQHLNSKGALRNLMDIPSISISLNRENVPMVITTDGSTLTPSLVNFESDRPFPLNQLKDDWFAEKILASNTGDGQATAADPVILRDGNRGRIAIVHQVGFEDNPKGEVAAEIIINYLLAAPDVPATHAADVNGDGTVNDEDASLVTEAISNGSTDAKYDVNGDGNVNFDDLQFVLENRAAGSAGAPRIGGNLKLSAAQMARIEAQIDLLIATGDRSPAAIRTLIYLQQFLATARPEKTQLLANYPNPFNPETWIPYELATDTHVRITIYNTQGVVIRTLALGHQSAGSYTGRDRAAYWDGRNAVGERVASGAYFYTLTTSDFTATRKMLILK